MKDPEHIVLEALLVEPGRLLRETVKVGEGLHHLSRYSTLRLLVSGCDECVILLEINLEATGVNPIIVGEGIVQPTQV